jgi:dihydroorotate dehydrogenase electron transfer subunit
VNAASGVTAGTPQAGKHWGERGRVLGRVTGNDSRGRLSWLTVAVPAWIGARPGQFALLQAELSCRFLARAFSVAHEATNGVSFLIDPVGEGTHELCDLGPGDPVWVLGPLGNGFDLDEIVSGGSPPEPSETSLGGASRLLLVAGGVGVAPFPLFLSRLADHETARALRPEVVLLAGFLDASQAQAVVPLEAAVARANAAGLACRLAVASEDGSLGPPRKATDLLERELRPGDRVVVCGSAAMSAAVWQVCCTVEGVHAWFSLEANMACGVGSCHGCAITLTDGSFARVCHEGPVFPGDTVFAPSAATLDRAERPA